MGKWKKIRLACTAAAVMMLMICPAEAAASTSVSVNYPSGFGTEDSPFDFILDPFGLIDETDAMRYGGGNVEKGATLLFYNQDGEYDFSKESDKLTIVTGEPAEVTVSACLSDLGELAVMEDRDFSGNDVCGIYLALVDDRGNEQPLSADGEVSVSLSMESGSYSFGLTGACNPDGDWKKLSVCPKVTVTWHVETAEMEEEEVPVLDEEEEETDTGGEAMQEPVSETGSLDLDDEDSDSVSGSEEPESDMETVDPEDGEADNVPERNISDGDRAPAEELDADGSEIAEPENGEADSIPEKNVSDEDRTPAEELGADGSEIAEPDLPEQDPPEGLREENVSSVEGLGE